MPEPPVPPRSIAWSQPVAPPPPPPLYLHSTWITSAVATRTSATRAYVNKVFNSGFIQLGQKFKYSKVDPDLKARELGLALELLNLAALIYKCYHTSGNGVPLRAESDDKKFKLFYVDVGLAQRALGLNLNTISFNNHNLWAHRGGLAEQLVAQELIALTKPNTEPELFYWHREKKSAEAEIDFVFAWDQVVIPIEVKSGNSGKQKSLKIFMEEKSSSLGFRMSLSPYQKIETDQIKIINLPPYGILAINEILAKLLG
jgi:predicted AAA+ superfamily ATPase